MGRLIEAHDYKKATGKYTSTYYNDKGKKTGHGESVLMKKKSKNIGFKKIQAIGPIGKMAKNILLVTKKATGYWALLISGITMTPIVNLKRRVVDERNICSVAILLVKKNPKDLLIININRRGSGCSIKRMGRLKQKALIKKIKSTAPGTATTKTVTSR